MAEITRRRSGELLRGVMGVLAPHTDGLPAAQAIALTEQAVPPTTFENDEYPNRPGVRRYPKLIRFCSITAVKAGWLVKSKGTWTVTDLGREALAKFSDPEALMKESIRLYREWKQDQPIVEDSTTVTVDDEEVGASPSAALEEAQEAAWRTIGDHLAEMPPFDFQDLIAALLRAMGYHVAWVSPPGPDRGLDILAYNDPLGATGPRIKVQVKRWNTGKVSVDGVRSFMATLGTQDVGIFVALAGFTAEAEREARSQENRRLMLVAAERLVDLWIEHYDRIDESERRLLPLKPVYYLDSPP